MCVSTNTLSHKNTLCTQLTCCGNSLFPACYSVLVPCCLHAFLHVSQHRGHWAGFKDWSKSLNRFPGDELIECVCCTCQLIFPSHNMENIVLDDGFFVFHTTLGKHIMWITEPGVVLFLCVCLHCVLENEINAHCLLSCDYSWRHRSGYRTDYLSIFAFCMSD